MFVMRGLVVFSLLLVAVILSSCSSNANDEKTKSPDFEFSTFTKSVCQGSGNFTACESELFVNCSGRIYRAEYFNGCNGMELDVPAVSGFAVFDNDKWKDPRK